MRSVSISSPRTGTAVPSITMRRVSAVTSINLSSLDIEQLARVGHAARERRCGDHGRAHQQGSPAGRALTTLEVTVGRGCADLAPLELVGVHGQTHRATGLTELEARFGEELVVTSLHERPADVVRARHDQGANVGGHL